MTKSITELNNFANKMGIEQGYSQAVIDYYGGKWDYKSPVELIEMGKEYSEAQQPDFLDKEE